MTSNNHTGEYVPSAGKVIFRLWVRRVDGRYSQSTTNKKHIIIKLKLIARVAEITIARRFRER